MLAEPLDGPIYLAHTFTALTITHAERNLSYYLTHQTHPFYEYYVRHTAFSRYCSVYHAISSQSHHEHQVVHL